MRFVLFYHSVVSDWNNGNAHFLRGVITELQARGHAVLVCEPRSGWSRTNLVAEYGAAAITHFQQAFPGLHYAFYDLASLDLDATLDSADVVIVHEWSDPQLVQRIGAHRARTQSYTLLFHDTHHRSVTAPAAMRAYDLRHYDGVLAFGAKVRNLYLQHGWAEHVWVWHEAADTRLFYPRPTSTYSGDVVWIGNWGDEERSNELREFLINPVRELHACARVYGVRYPPAALQELSAAGMEYAGWLPNYQAPQVLAQFRATVHVLRRPYVESLPGIPTIRVFEALACGIPLICSPWDDCEHLFAPGVDFLIAHSGAEMQRLLQQVLSDAEFAQTLARNGLRTIRERHTCRHRVDELLAVCAELGQPRSQGGTSWPMASI